MNPRPIITQRASRRRSILGAALFVPLAVGALVAPAKLHAGNAGALNAAPTSVSTGTSTPPRTQHPTGAGPTPGSAGTTSSSSPPAHTGPLTSSCRSVLYIGDSTSEGVVSTNYLPDQADREKAQLRDVGVTDFVPEISGARAIVEHYKGEPSGMDIVDTYVARGFQGCWIIALGNNDAADISIGARPDAGGRIDMLMKKIGDRPVLWVNTRTLVSSGPNAESNMLTWNDALTQACTRYPNLQIYDWAGEVQPQWYTPTDNIHYTTPGYRARSRGIARATAIAFPAKGGPPANCLVSSH
ncbi:MAG: hypothetical protein M3Y49_18420 [Actinomycetota bacterium]|nr:hypothetical protein [Actinomycetota bacterium]